MPKETDGTLQDRIRKIVREKIAVVPYDSNWPEWERFAASLTHKLRPNLLSG